MHMHAHIGLFDLSQSGITENSERKDVEGERREAESKKKERESSLTKKE